MSTPYQRWDDHFFQPAMTIQIIPYIRLTSDKFAMMIWYNSKNSNTLICRRFLILLSIPISNYNLTSWFYIQEGKI